MDRTEAVKILSEANLEGDVRGGKARASGLISAYDHKTPEALETLGIQNLEWRIGNGYTITGADTASASVTLTIHGAEIAKELIAKGLKFKNHESFTDKLANFTPDTPTEVRDRF